MTEKQNPKIGFVNSGRGIGDKIQFTSLPENYFLHTGRRMIDIEKEWIFDYNPFVERDIQPDIIVNLWTLMGQYDEYIKKNNLFHEYTGTIMKNCRMLGIPCRIRTPKLYIYDDLIPNSKQICVHTNGVSEGGTIPDEVIAEIHKRYTQNGYNVIQIGGKNDRDTGFSDFRGAPLLETTKIIATSEMFIGVNSGMMNIANCYPRVRKKIVILQFSEERLKYFVPGSNLFSHWIDFGLEYFNKFDYDVGITHSYKTI